MSALPVLVRVDIFLKPRKRLYLRGMVASANVAAVPLTWNMITLFRSPVAVRVTDRIFNCFVKNAIEVNQIAVIVRYTIVK